MKKIFRGLISDSTSNIIRYVTGAIIIAGIAFNIWSGNAAATSWASLTLMWFVISVINESKANLYRGLVHDINKSCEETVELFKDANAKLVVINRKLEADNVLLSKDIDGLKAGRKLSD